MRSMLLFFVIMIVTPSALIMPHLGVLIWSWISIMNPHRLSWGLSFDFPFVMIVACVTLAAWLISREPKLPPSRFLTWAAFVFVILMTVSTYASLHPDHSWPLWDRAFKNFVLFFIAAIMINSKVRIQALLWIVAISIGYYATIGVMETIYSGGRSVLTGPARTMIGDNNHMALALVIILPVLNYLRLTTAHRLVKLALLAVLIFALVAIITSYSRGSLIALAVAALAFLRSNKGRLLLLILVVSVSLFVINAMPDRWQERVTSMESIESIQDDRSFSGRMDAWTVSWRLAVSRPLVGGGFSAIEHPSTFLRFLPEANRGRAAHSIFFQVLGDHGFIALALYVLMYAAVWLHLRRTRIRARGRPDLVWADQLAKMLQISILAFVVGGSALSAAYYDLNLLFFAVAMNLDIITARKSEKVEAAFSTRNQQYDMQLS